MADDEDPFTRMTVKLTDEQMERYEKLCSTKSGTARLLISSWMDAVEEHGLEEQPEQIQLAMLQMYRNAFEKHIDMMEMQKEQIEDAIEEMEGDDSEVIMEIDLKLKPKNL